MLYFNNEHLKQPKCSLDGQMAKPWHRHTMKYYMAVKKNEVNLWLRRRISVACYHMKRPSCGIVHMYGIICIKKII